MRTTALLPALLLALSPAALAVTPQTDTVGGNGGQSFGSGSFKLDEFEVRETVELQEIEFLLGTAGPTDVYFVVYENPGGFGGWDLVWDSGPVGIPGGEDFKSSGAITGQLLERGRNYGIGVFLPDGSDAGYFFGDVGGEDIGWAVMDRAYYAQNGTYGATPPDPAFGQDSGSPYRMRITVGLGDDGDGDGVGEFDDCNDGDATIYPGAEEACDEVDNNCNGEIDENVSYYDVYPDEDGDGFANTDGEPMSICDAVPPDGYSSRFGDCDDTNPAVNPDAEEICDGLDNDCDGVKGPQEGIDGDFDGVPVCADCDDADPDVFPGRSYDPCNGVDSDCDGEIPTSAKECDPFEAGEGLSAASACACDSQGGGGLAWLGLVGLVALRRRD